MNGISRNEKADRVDYDPAKDDCGLRDEVKASAGYSDWWAALSGAAVGGATGGLVGGLVGLGIPEVEAKRYETKLKDGNYLIAVHTHDGDQKTRAMDVFKNAGAEDITSSAMSKAPEARTA